MMLTNSRRIFMIDYTNDYLLNLKVKIFQPVNGYRSSTDAVLLSSLPDKVKKGDAVLDVGSGTGAISLCLAHRFRQLGISICGFELQKELASLSAQSAAANGFSDFLNYCCTDIRSRNIPFPPGSFQHVITNPPYSAADMKSPNPGKSLAHNFEHFSLGEWIRFCLKMLAPFGYFYTVNRAEALPEILCALHGRAGENVIIPIYSKTGQSAKRVIVCARKDSKGPAAVLPGFTVHNDDGTYTPSAEAILRDGKSFWETGN